jgi:hypothetical protein
MYFMECSLDLEGKLSFKLSELVTVVYKDENLQVKVDMVTRKGTEASESFVKWGGIKGNKKSRVNRQSCRKIELRSVKNIYLK